MRNILAITLTTLIVGSLVPIYAVKGHIGNNQAKDSITHQRIGEKVVAVIQRKRTESLKGYVLVICKASTWKDLEKDSDLGPFLKHKTAASNLDAIVVMPPHPKEGSTYCIYLQEDRPIGFVEIKTAQGEEITEKNVAKGYISVTEESGHVIEGQVRFEEVVVYSDDNKPIPTLRVISEGKNQQEDYSSGAIKTKYGFLLVWNVPKNHYTLEIRGKDVRQISTERIQFRVNGMFLQILTAPTKDFIADAKRQKLDDRVVLEAHRDWEVKFMEGEYKEKLKVESSWQRLRNGKEALVWQINVPESARSNVKKQISLTLIKGEYVLMLGGVVTETIEESKSRQLLVDTIETLKTSDKPIDLRKLQEMIRKDASNGSGT